MSLNRLPTSGTLSEREWVGGVGDNADQQQQCSCHRASTVSVKIFILCTECVPTCKRHLLVSAELHTYSTVVYVCWCDSERWTAHITPGVPAIEAASQPSSA